jgi:hypothetical protein
LPHLAAFALGQRRLSSPGGVPFRESTAKPKQRREYYMGGTTEQVTNSTEQATNDGPEEAKEWIEQAQEEADRQAQEVKELPDQAY